MEESACRCARRLSAELGISPRFRENLLIMLIKVPFRDLKQFDLGVTEA